MIYSNLKRILKEKSYTISRVAEKTGIGRTTVTSLFHNMGNGIQFETLEKLCDFLEISISDLLTFIPFNINVYSSIYSNVPVSNSTYTFDCTLELNPINHKKGLSIPLDLQLTRYTHNSFEVIVAVYEEDIYDYQRFIDKAPSVAIEIIEEEVYQKIVNDISEIDDISEDEDLDISFNTENFKKWDKWDMYEYLTKK